MLSFVACDTSYGTIKQINTPNIDINHTNIAHVVLGSWIYNIQQHR
jgi:hypothetical protein